MDPFNLNFGSINQPLLTSSSNSLSRAANINETSSTTSGNKNKSKRNSKLIPPENPPLVNPALTDGAVQPVAISDFDDPLKVHHLPRQSQNADLVSIRINHPTRTCSTNSLRNWSNFPIKSRPSSVAIPNNYSQPHKSIPSFCLTKNVTSTLSKLTDAVAEYSSLPQTIETNSNKPVLNNCNNNLMDIPMTSFSKNSSMDQISNHNKQRYSMASSASNPSSDVSGDPSTTSSLYYVDCSHQNKLDQSAAKPRSSSSVSSSIDSSSTLTRYSSNDGNSDDNEPTLNQNEPTNFNDTSTFEGQDNPDDLPPPPDALLQDDDDEQPQQLTPTNKSAPANPIQSPKYKNVAQLLPPLPPSDYHSISTLQRRKQQFASVNGQQNKVSEVPAYVSTATLRSFQGSNSSNSRSGTLRKPPPPPPPRPCPPPPLEIGAVDRLSYGIPSSNSSYADPSTLSLGSSCSPMDNLTMSTHPTPSPTSDYQHPEALNQQQSQPKPTRMFANNQSPTYRWVFNQHVSAENGNHYNNDNDNSAPRCDSLSLAESGSVEQPNSLESGDSRQPLSHSFDSNNNSKGTMDTFVYRNRMFVDDDFSKTRDNEEDISGKTKARIIDQPYRMLFDSPDDIAVFSNGNAKLNSKDSIPNGTPKRKQNRCCQCIQSTIITLLLTILILIMCLFGYCLIHKYVIHSPTGSNLLNNIIDLLPGHYKTDNNDNDVANTNSTSMHNLTETLTTLSKILSTTWKPTSILPFTTNRNLSQTTSSTISTTTPLPTKEISFQKIFDSITNGIFPNATKFPDKNVNSEPLTTTTSKNPLQDELDKLGKIFSSNNHLNRVDILGQTNKTADNFDPAIPGKEMLVSDAIKLLFF